MKLVSTNPSNGYEILGSVEVSTPSDIARIVKEARESQPAWQSIGVKKRAELIKKLLDVFKKNKDEFVRRTSLEMGMPTGLSEFMVGGDLNKIEWDTENAENILKSTILFEDNTEINEQVYEPYGVMVCIAAWNFPFGNFAMSVVPSLLAGNTVVMKYSEEVPLFSKFLEETILNSGILPKNVMNFVYGDGIVGAELCAQPIDMISFTGSSDTGQKIYLSAAQKLIPACLELGGSSPGIVFENCTLTDEVIQSIFWKRFLNTAQFCDGVKRLIVHASLYDECVQKLVAYASTVKIGNPLDKDTQMGPLVAERQVLKLEGQIQDALDKGAKIICGGRRPKTLKGAYYEPTILTNITKTMRVWTEEVFGPALPVVSFKTYEEAIELAHDTQYGLSAIVYSDDKNTIKRAQNDLKVGYVDDGFAHVYRPQNPLGGYKKSGIGRQGGIVGYQDVCQVKVKAYRK